MRTPRLELRRWTEDDAEAFHRIWGDPEVVFWGPAPDVAASRAVLRRVIARCDGRPPPVGWHAVLERSGGPPVGNVVLQPAAFSPGDLEVGWHLRRDRWGRGYATEAARALVEEAFAALAVPRLVCAILPENVRSQAVARRLGFSIAVRGVTHAGLAHDVWTLARPPPAGGRPEGGDRPAGGGGLAGPGATGGGPAAGPASREASGTGR